MRIATYDAGLQRDGPGLLLRDLLKPDMPQIDAALAMIVALDADILLLTGMDQDPQGAALTVLARRLAQAGLAYPHRLPLLGNRGIETALDLDGDGYAGGAGDAQGWGRFTGAGAMALLSRHPIDESAILDLSSLLWRDMPGADLPVFDGGPFPSAEAQAVQRLSSSGHYAIPVMIPQGRITLLAFAATPPVFDGPEDANGRRNADEIRLWEALLRGDLEWPPPPAPRVLLGNANLDPLDGEGQRRVMADLLAGPRWQDSRPAASFALRGDPAQTGPPAQDTAFWRTEKDGGPGALRVDYVLAEQGLRVARSGIVHAPGWGDPVGAAPSSITSPTIAGRASAHRPVWIEIELPPPVH